MTSTEMKRPPFEEVVPNDRAIWQSDKAKTYQCPFCLRPIFSQYEGEELPLITCGATIPAGHRLQWDHER